MKSVQISHIVRLLALSFCVFLLPSCKLVSSIVKLPVNVVKSTARMVGVSNLTDHPGQPVSKGLNSGSEANATDSTKESRSLD
jgi:hypothetical protein